MHISFSCFFFCSLTGYPSCLFYGPKKTNPSRFIAALPTMSSPRIELGLYPWECNWECNEPQHYTQHLLVYFIFHLSLNYNYIRNLTHVSSYQPADLKMQSHESIYKSILHLRGHISFQLDVEQID